MEAYPEDVTTTLLRGLGRYIREAPASDLPSGVRRFKDFRDKALARHRDALLSILDSDATRALIVQWLDEDKPSLPKDVEELMRLVTARPAGWEEAVAARSSIDQAPSLDGVERATRLETAVEKEKEKTAKAKEELKSERESFTRSLADATADKTKAERMFEEQQAALEEALRRAEESEAQLDKERDRSERELRRARRDAERALLRVDELTNELKEARASLRAFEQADRIDDEPQQKPRRRAKTSAPRRRSGPRRALKVPKGLPGNDPDTLSAWLARDDVQLLVDGYNVTKAESGFGDLSLESQRERLITELNNLALRKKIEVTIVFDGASVVRPKTRRAKVRTVFTAEEEIADDVIVELLEGLPPVPVVVATNDRELQGRVSALGATVAASDQLLALLR